MAVRCINSTTPGTPAICDPPPAPPGPPTSVKLILLYKNIVYYAMHQHCRTVTPQRGRRMADEPIAGPLNCVEVPL
jgi:hypothetical protein